LRLKLTILNLCFFGLRLIYAPLRLLPRQNKVTLISRMSSRPGLDFVLLKQALKLAAPGTRVVMLTHLQDSPWDLARSLPYMLRQLYAVATSRVVVIDAYSVVVSKLNHRPGLTVIQMWHSLGVVKKAGYSSIGMPDGRSSVVANVLNLHRNYTYVCVSSDTCRPCVAQVFNCDPKMLVTMPLPRVDVLRDAKWRERVRSRLLRESPSLATGRLLLYLPTYRKDETELQQKLDELVLAARAQGLTLIVKPHRLSTSRVPVESRRACRGRSTDELLTVSDVVITDYSTAMFEAGLMQKPVLFYTFDLEVYQARRGLFMAEKDFPGNVHFTADSLLAAATNTDSFDFSTQDAFVKENVASVPSASTDLACLIASSLAQ
jgi:CDP-ribitol ribitolphosphotransferase